MIEFYINYTIVVLLIEEFFSRFCHILTAFEFIRVYIYIYIYIYIGLQVFSHTCIIRRSREAAAF